MGRSGNWLDNAPGKLPDAERAVLDAVEAETEFVEACIAVWEEIDRLSAQPGGYKGLASSTALRLRERAAWERYKEFLHRA